MKIDWEPPIVEDIWDVWMRRYEGAFVSCWNTGLYVSIDDEAAIWHIDVKGMYPSIMIMLNLSPESTRILEVKDYTGKYGFGEDFVEVPDRSVGQLRLSVESKDSITRRSMIRFRGMREQIRVDKQMTDRQREGAQKGVKLTMNAGYGYHGLEFARYGFFPIAIATAATGRLGMKTIEKVCDEQDVTKLECDTDGLYEFGHNIADIVNERFHSMFECYAPFNKYVGVDVNRYDAMLVYSAKNYILRRDGHNRFKGSAFHGRHMPHICRVALERFADAVFAGEPFRTVWKDFEDLREFPLKEFTMNVQFRKDPSSYHGTTMYAKLARKIGEHARWGDDIYYVKLKDDYYPVGHFSDDVLKRRLDYGYYMQRIKDVVGRLSEALEPQRQKSLMGFT